MKNQRSRFPSVFLSTKSYVSLLLVLFLSICQVPHFQTMVYADELGKSDIETQVYIMGEDLQTNFGDFLNNPNSQASEILHNDVNQGITTLETLAGVYTISSAINTAKVFDIPGGSGGIQVVVQLWDNNHSVAQRFELVPNSDGTYTIKNIKSGLVLDVPGARVYNSAKIWQYTSNGTDAQKWLITQENNGFKIASKINPVFCLDVPGANASSGAQMTVYESNNTLAQRFSLNRINPSLSEGAYILNTQSASDMVLDISGASSNSGTIAQFYSSNMTLAQRFILTYDINTGYYTITNVQSGKSLEVAEASALSGARVQINQPNSAFHQKWAIVPLSNGAFGVYAAHNGLALGAPVSSIGNLTPAQVFTWNNSSNQQWVFTSSTVVNQNAYQIRSGVGTVLDVCGNGQSEGTRVWTYTANGTSAQKFYFLPVANGFYKLDCLNSGLVLTAQGTTIVLAKDQNLASQLWKIWPVGEGLFYFVNSQTNMVLDVAGGNSSPGTFVQAYAYNGTKAQIWSFEKTRPIPEGLYTIRSAADPNKVLDIVGNSLVNGARLNLYTENGTTAQIFKIENATDMNYRIIGVNSNKSIDVDNGILNPYGLIQQYTSWGGDSNPIQLWRIEYAGTGCYRFYSAAGNGQYCMTLESGSTANGTPIYAYPVDYSMSQLFYPINRGNSYNTPLRMTVSQMVQYQKSGNSWINDITTQQLLEVIDPSLTMQDYWYPGHPSQYKYGIMQFADLRVYTGLSASQLDAIINAFSPTDSNLRGKGYAFAYAASLYNINECYLLAHCALESGWGTSSLARGYAYDGITVVNGTTYPAATYHNFFGIGAVDSGPLTGGRAYAIMNGWDSIDKAIIGGAKWIVEGYIHRTDYSGNIYAQQTLYAMKWDYNRSNDTLTYGWHQYATDHLWARKIARMMGEFYNRVGVQPNLVYIIPRYAN